jgi:Uma2 family endonuclease
MYREKRPISVAAILEDLEPMATATAPRIKSELAPERFVFWDVGWQGYQSLLKMLENRRVRVTYDRGHVELMAPLSIHERYKHLTGRMIDTMAEELDIQVVAVGSTTFSSEELDRGLEPDECYYLANAGRVRDWKRVDLQVDPPPDLAVEVDITSSSLNRQGIYAALRVPEIWRFDGESMSVLLLQPDGTYALSETSLAFPFLRVSELAAFLLGYDLADDTRWGRTFREWVRATLVPRFEQ